MTPYKKTGVYIALIALLFQVFSPYVDAQPSIEENIEEVQKVIIEKKIEAPVDIVENIVEPTIEVYREKTIQLPQYKEQQIFTVTEVEQVSEAIISDEVTIIDHSGIISDEVEIVDVVVFEETIDDDVREAQFSYEEELTHFEEFIDDSEPQSYYESNNIPEDRNTNQNEILDMKPEEIESDPSL